MTKGYLIAQVTVTDPGAYGTYVEAAGKLMSAYGAKQILKPETAIVAEGKPKARTVIFEFDSFDTAKRFWNSPEYTTIKALRFRAAEADFILVEGSD